MMRTSYVFDSSNLNFTTDVEHSRFFIENSVRYFNDLLWAKGYVFLNDVLKYLGLPLRSIGQLVGWSKNGSGFVDIEIKQVVTRGFGDLIDMTLEIRPEGLIAFDVLED
jgi:hypothetical protein